MACKPICRLCDRLIISNSVTFADGNVIINIPAGDYRDGCKYCIVIAQARPATATVDAPVVITIGDGTVQYPLTQCDRSQVTVCGIRTRTRYSTVVSTNTTGGVFKLLSRTCCASENLVSINGTAPAAPAAPTT